VKTKGCREKINTLQIADLNYIGTYVSYFVIGLSIEKPLIFWIVFGLLSIFILRTKTVGFNIFHLLNGWHYYYVTNQDNVTMNILIKRNDIKKINEITTIDLGNNLYIGKL
jgi:hypothetical protein